MIDWINTQILKLKIRMIDWIITQIIKLKIGWYSAQNAYIKWKMEKIKKEQEELIRKLNRKDD